MSLTEKLPEEANRKFPMGNRMVTWPMTSRNPERSSCDPQHAYRAQHLENSGRCYLAAMASYLIGCCKPVRQ